MSVDALRNSMANWPRERIIEQLRAVTRSDVERALRPHGKRGIEDFVALISPAAASQLEPMAQEAHRLTRRQFGRTIGLYVPLYLSNVCRSDCTYCGYAIRSGNREKRRTLKEDEIRRECESLAAQGFQNVLLLTGEARHAASVDYIRRSVEIAREYFSSVSIEVYSLEGLEYSSMAAAGLEGVTCYMETYDRGVYSQVHLEGEKADYVYRLGASERAGRASVRKLGIGVLLGLTDWRVDTVWLAIHALHLQKTCWQSSLSISFPRLRHTPERFAIPNIMSDAELVQVIAAMRLLLPEAGFNLSTREPAALRNRMIPLGITMMSAGSSTRPGGYTITGEETLEQFEIEDTRPMKDVVAAIRGAGYDPVFKDFDRAFDSDRAVSPASAQVG